MEELNKYLSRLSEHHDMYVQVQATIPISCIIETFTNNAIGLRLDRVKSKQGKVAIASSCLRLLQFYSYHACTINSKFKIQIQDHSQKVKVVYS